MLRAIKSIFEKEPLKLVFNVSLEEAISRLSKSINSNYYQDFFSDRMVGEVTKNKVFIYGKISGRRKSFNRHLVGEFKEENKKAVLSGHLKHPKFIKVFISACIGFIFFWEIAVISVIIANLNNFKIEALLFPIAGLFLFLFMLSFIKFGKLQSRNDKKWLIEKVKQAINHS